MSLRRYTFRAMQQRPGRTILTLLSIVIGVAATVAIDLGTATTRISYRQMFATVTGKATLEITAAGGVGFKADSLALVEGNTGVKAATPLVEKPSKLFLEKAGGEKRDIRIQVMGIDPARDSGVREYDIVDGRQVESKKNELVLDEEFAKFLELKVGDEVKLLTRKLTKQFQIVGLLKPRGGEGLRQAALIYMPLDRAQVYFYPAGKTDLVDKIQIVTADDKAEVERVQAEIAALLPTTPKLEVHRPAGDTQLMEHTLKASEQGLRLTSMFSLLLAAFIILNTLLMNVGERRRQLAIMRAIGTTSKQLAWSLISESLILGIVGTLLGIAAGIGVGWLSNRILAQAFEVQLSPLGDVLTARPIILGAVFGLGMSLLGALIPAVRVGKISALEGLSRIPPETTRSHQSLFFWTGISFILLAAVLVVGGLNRVISTDGPMYGGLCAMIGVVCLETVFLRVQCQIIAAIIRPFRPVETSLALKQVLRHNTRSALTVGVLFIAGATGLGMANSILDNVRDVDDWYRTAIVGDFFVRAAMPDMASGTSPDLPDELGEEIAQLKNDPDLPAGAIKNIGGLSFVQATLLDRSTPSDSGEPAEVTAICVARQFNNTMPPPFDLTDGDPATLREDLFAGQAVVGSVLAQKMHVQRGDILHLKAAEGVVEVPIAAITNEYMVGGMALHMERGYVEKYLGIHGFDGWVIEADKKELAAVKAKLEPIAKKYDVLLHSYADISHTISRIVDGTQWSLWALVALGFVVAAFGVVNTLSMNVLEQTRELGLLRIVAMTKPQVRRTIVTQALIIGGVGLPPGILVGVLIAYIMNLAMLDSIGHEVSFHLYPALMGATLGGGLIIIVVAAIIPALRATRINVAMALHYE